MTDDLIEAFRAIVGADHVLCDACDTEPYLQDWRGRYHGRARAVVRPATAEQVAAVVARCGAAGVPIVPQGGNTGLCGGATPDASGQSVVVSLARLRRIRAIDPLNSTLVAESGCTLTAVQQAAREAERLFPLSLAAEGSCQIGGNLSTNAGGVHVLRYGNMRDLVLGVEVVLPDGRIWNGLRALRKNNTGYDLKHLFIGAEGTLGIVTAVVLKLFPLPVARRVAWVAVADAGRAVALLDRARTLCGDKLNAFELVGRPALELVLQHVPGCRRPLQVASDWGVLIEVNSSRRGDDLDALLEALLSEAVSADEALDAVLAGSEVQAEALWRLRESISEAQRLEGMSIKHDISVPVSSIPSFLMQADSAVRDRFSDLRVVAFGHVGDGNLHYNLSAADPASNEALLACTSEANRIVHDLVAQLGGSISAEHGLGQLKREEILRYREPLETEIMRKVKDALDPRGLMNPGKLL